MYQALILSLVFTALQQGSKVGGFTLLPLQIHQGLWESISASEVGLSREAASA